jgi:hypothetical protein
MNKTKDKNKKVLSLWWKGFVNSKKKADAQRLTAMMIINLPQQPGYLEQFERCRLCQ